VFFYYDSTQPTIAVQKPNLEFHKTLTTISGTANDIIGGVNKAGIRRVYFAVQYPPVSGQWWTGAAHNFTLDDPNWVEASTTAVSPPTPVPWWSSSVPSWIHGNTYRIRARAVDNAGNVVTSSDRDFTLDERAPTVSLVLPPLSANANYNAQKTLATISGTALDNQTLPDPDSWLKSVSIRIYDTNNTERYWNSASQEFDILVENA
jgi:hypothetical protein